MNEAQISVNLLESNKIDRTHPLKAVGLISGGLDSTLAVKIVKDLCVDVYGVYFSMPWGCCDKVKAMAAAQQMGINFIVLQLDERYLEIVRRPRYGYGRAMNPCVDCRIHMFSRAAQYMKHIGADFVFTGEVLGQRLMSQMRRSMKWVEEGAGLKGRLLRPLCAQLLEPTQLEKEGLIDRQKLLAIAGRSRKEQLALADRFQISAYNQPAGGCLLTDKNFARRMKDTLDHGYRNFRETTALKWGRHFRLDGHFKAVIGRDERENDALLRYRHPEDLILQLAEGTGPTVILKGNSPTEDILATAAGLLQRFSRYKDQAPVTIQYASSYPMQDIRYITAKALDEFQIRRMQI